MKMFDAAVILASQKCGQDEVDYYMSLPLIEHEFSKRHEKRMARLFKRERYSDIRTACRIFAKRAAVAVLVICTLLFGTVISIKAVREDIWQSVTEFFEKYFSFGTDDPYSQQTITEYKVPTWLPEGYSETQTAKAEQNYTIGYFSEDGILLLYSQYLYHASSVLYDNEGANVSDVKINGLDGKFITYGEGKDENILIWYDDIYCYSLVSELSGDVMTQIAENVK